jgi:hypothetical protein
VVYDSAAPFTASFGKSEWDIILTGKNAVVGKLLDFSADLFLIEYVYVAAPGREFAGPPEVDAPGIRVAVPRNASADVFLSRTAKSAELVRVDGDLNSGIELLRTGKVDVYATSINNARVMVSRMPEAKIVGAFNTVVFAVAVQKGRSVAAQEKLRNWSMRLRPLVWSKSARTSGRQRRADRAMKLMPERTWFLVRLGCLLL